MTIDSLGFRKKFAVIAPSTNTSVQPEYDSMRPYGVTNHFARIHIRDSPLNSNQDFLKLIQSIREEIFMAVDRVKTCGPDSLILGMSAETFWDGKKGSKELQKKIENRSKVPVVMGSDACIAALEAYENIKRISVLTPYMPVGDEQVEMFFDDCGFEVKTILGLKCASPQLIAHESQKRLKECLIELNRSDVDAIVQVGTNLACAKLAGIAEFWLDKPVIAINTATYWWALRTNNIADKIPGFGDLLLQH